MDNQPTARRACAHWRTGRGCLRSQRGACSIPRRWPTLIFNATSPSRRLRLRIFVTVASEFCGARPALASPRGEPTDRPRSTRELPDLASLSLQPTRSAVHPTPLAKVPLQSNLARLVAAASTLRDNSFRTPCRAASARFALCIISRPPAEHVHTGGLRVVVIAANAERAASLVVGRGSSSTQPRQVGGCGYESSCP